MSLYQIDYYYVRDIKILHETNLDFKCLRYRKQRACFAVIMQRWRCVRDAQDSPQPRGYTNPFHLTGIKCDTELLSHTPDHIITLERWGKQHWLLHRWRQQRRQRARTGHPNGEIQKLSHWCAVSSRYTESTDRSAGAGHFPVLLVFHPDVWKRRCAGTHDRSRLFTHRDAVSAEDLHLRLDSQTGFPQQSAQHGWFTSAEHRSHPRTGSLRTPHVHLLRSCHHRPTPSAVLFLPARLPSTPQQRPHQTVSKHLPAGPLAPGVHGRDDAAKDVWL